VKAKENRETMENKDFFRIRANQFPECVKRFRARLSERAASLLLVHDEIA
jgi:hypothetical protein